MADISRIRVDSTTYDLKDARLPAPGADGTTLVADDGAWTVGTVGGDSPVESGTGAGSVQSKQYESYGSTYVQAATANGATALGGNTIASGGMSLAEGSNTKAQSLAAHSEGDSTQAGYLSHAEGDHSIAWNEAHAEGTYTVSNYSHSEGRRTAAYAPTDGRAHAEGNGWYYELTPTAVSEDVVTFESIPSEVNDTCNIVVNPDTGVVYRTTSVDHSNNQMTFDSAYGEIVGHTLRVYSQGIAYGRGAHAEGYCCKALFDGSHAEGMNTTSIAAHSEGLYTQANGAQCHAEGDHTIATGTNQHVQGKYNIEDTNNTYAHIVGNGTNTARSNAHTLDWNGNAWYAGTVSAGTVANPATVTNANDLTTKSYVDTQVSYKMSKPSGWSEGEFLTLHEVTGELMWAVPGGGDSPVESGTGAGSVQTKAFLDGTTTKTQVAYGVGSMAEGAGTYAIGTCSHAEGYCSSSLGEITVTAEINSSAYSPVYSVASLPTSFHVGCCILGTYQNVPVGRKVQAINTSTLQITLDGRLDNYDSYTYSYTGQGALGPYSHIEGRGIVASGNSSHAEGYGAARGDMSHAEGDSTAANGQASHAEGSATKAQNQYSHAEGYGTSALADGAHVEGAYGRATGKYSHVEGWDDFWYHTISSSSLSLVSGTTYRLNVPQWPYYLNVGCILAQSYNSTTYYKVTAIDLNARTITLDNNLSDTNSTYYVFTLVAVGNGSHAEGSSVAMASYSHAEGEYCVSSGSSSHSEGYNTIAKGNNQHVEGKYNVEDTDNKYAHITGIGTSATSRKNGFTVDWDGNGAFATSVQAPKVDTQYLQVGYHGQGGHAFGQALTHGGVIEGTGVLANIGHVEATPNMLAIGRMYITGSYTQYNYDPNDSQIANTIKNAYTGCVLHIPSLGLYGILESLDTDNNSIAVNYLDEEITDPTLAYLYNPNIYGENSHAEGEGSTVLSRYSHAEGSGTTVGGVTLTVQDTIDHHLDVNPNFNNTPSNGRCSHAEGYRTSIIGQYAHAQGFMSQVFGNAAHAGGLFSVAYGNGSTANAAGGMISVHDINEYTGYGQYARSLILTARLSDQEYTDDYDGDVAYSRRFSFADNGASSGILPGMIAIYQVGVYKLARKILSIDFTGHIVVFDGPLPFENISTQNTIQLTVYAAAASGEASHCEGLATVAGGDYSHAEGECTVALGEGQHVSGRANIIDTNNTYASIVGNGTFTSQYTEVDAEFSINVNNRSNAYTLDWSGNGWFAGNITANGGSLTLHDSTGDVTITAAQLRQLLAMLS